MSTVKIKIVDNGIKSNYPLFSRATEGSLGFDLYSATDTIIHTNEVEAIPLGFAIALPHAIGMFIYPRSGLASRGIMVANAPGLIDSDYRGEVKVLLYNSTDNIFKVQKGDRIAQALFFGPIMFNPAIHFSLVDELPASDRGEGGFGSTGR